MHRARGNYWVTVDDDGKNSNEQITAMILQLIEKDHKFVYGKPSNFPNGVFRGTIGTLFRKLLSEITKNPNWMYQSSFRGFSNLEFIAENPKILQGDSLDALLLRTF